MINGTIIQMMTNDEQQEVIINTSGGVVQISQLSKSSTTNVHKQDLNSNPYLSKSNEVLWAKSTVSIKEKVPALHRNGSYYWDCEYWGTKA